MERENDNLWNLKNMRTFHMHKGEKSLSENKRNNIHSALEIFGHLKIRGRRTQVCDKKSSRNYMWISAAKRKHWFRLAALSGERGW